MPPSEKTRGPFSQIGSAIDDYWPIAASTIGTIILSFSTNLIIKPAQAVEFSRWETLTEWGGILLFLLGGLGAIRAVGRANRVVTENEQLRELVRVAGDDIQDKFKNLLIQIFKDGGFGNDSRITLYRHEDSRFISLARFSPDPGKAKTGRGFYPDNEGCIGAAYRDKESYVFDLPEAGTPDYFDAMMDNWGYDPQVVNIFTMQPRSIAAFALEDDSDYTRNLMVVFESTEENAFAIRRLRRLCGKFSEALLGLAVSLESVMPSLTYASEKGF